MCRFGDSSRQADALLVLCAISVPGTLGLGLFSVLYLAAH
jgi:hypothetical protein